MYEHRYPSRRVNEHGSGCAPPGLFIAVAFVMALQAIRKLRGYVIGFVLFFLGDVPSRCRQLRHQHRDSNRDAVDAAALTDPTVLNNAPAAAHSNPNGLARHRIVTAHSR